MKKVILLAPTPPPAGGIAGWTLRMTRAKFKNDWAVVVVDEKSFGSREVFGKKGRMHFLNEVHRCFKIWNDLRIALKDPDCMVVHSCIPSYSKSMLRECICAIISRWNKRKFVIHFRCTVPNSKDGIIWKIVLFILCNLSDFIITLNEPSRLFLDNFTETPIVTIPNFIAVEELVNEHIIRPKIERIIYVGGLVRDKGVSDIIKIAERLPDIQFILVGKGDDIYEKEVKLKKLRNVIFTGGLEHSEVVKELFDADIFLFMTFFRGEGFSNALCEAMASGLPCIVTDWAANKDMIEDAGGTVVEVGDVDAAVSAINKMRSWKLRHEMSIKNINKVRDNYLESVVVNQYVDVYERL